MAIQYHVKGGRRRARELRQQNASAIRRGRPALIITSEKKEAK
jgi:hypothetical protein